MRHLDKDNDQIPDFSLRVEAQLNVSACVDEHLTPRLLVLGRFTRGDTRKSVLHHPQGEKRAPSLSEWLDCRG